MSPSLGPQHLWGWREVQGPMYEFYSRKSVCIQPERERERERSVTLHGKHALAVDNWWVCVYRWLQSGRQMITKNYFTHCLRKQWQDCQAWTKLGPIPSHQLPPTNIPTCILCDSLQLSEKSKETRLGSTDKTRLRCSPTQY